MKSWLFSLCCFALIIITGLLSRNFLFQSSASLIKKLDQIEPSVQHSQWKEAKVSVGLLRSAWTGIKPRWALLIHHQEIDNIDSALMRLDRSVISASFSDSQTSSGELRLFLQHIPLREEFTWVNIL